MDGCFDNGKFVISLDFELFWGVRDKKSLLQYGDNIIGVKRVIPALLELFDQYDIRVTFSTVGFLFASNKHELLFFSPNKKPGYKSNNLSPYDSFSNVGINEEDDPYHFGYSLVKSIRDNGRHEIGTHTYSHYYCLEEGQTQEEFQADLTAAIKIAANLGVELRSIVFPRNQYNNDYLKICCDSGLTCFRGNPDSWLYEARKNGDEKIVRRVLRLIDAYFNITGHHCHAKEYLKKGPLVNIAGSRFLRPWNAKLAWIEPIRLRRIKKSMLFAARNKLLFHLWWHPHNFGVNLNENLEILEEILMFYQGLRHQYGFQSITMSELSDQMNR